MQIGQARPGWIIVRFAGATLCVFLASLSLAGCGSAGDRTLDETIEQTFQIDPSTTISIRNLNGKESSMSIRKRVVGARECQQERFARDPKTSCNARMTTRHLKEHCKLNAESQELIRVAMSELNLSARAYDRILKVSRTIADLAGAADIAEEHVSEAIQYRTFDRTLWV